MRRLCPLTESIPTRISRYFIRYLLLPCFRLCRVFLFILCHRRPCLHLPRHRLCRVFFPNPCPSPTKSSDIAANVRFIDGYNADIRWTFVGKGGKHMWIDSRTEEISMKIHSRTEETSMRKEEDKRANSSSALTCDDVCWIHMYFGWWWTRFWKLIARLFSSIFSHAWSSQQRWGF